MAKTTARKSIASKKKATTDKARTTTVTASRRHKIPEAPAAPTTGPTPHKKKARTGVQADIGRAESALLRAIATYEEQKGFPENFRVDFRPLHARIVELNDIYEEKASIKAKATDTAYDWAAFKQSADELEANIFQAVIDDFVAKADRMAWTGKLKFSSVEDREALQATYDWADNQKHARAKIWAWSEVVKKKLPLLHCSDPWDEQPRGGRQQGGNRRGR